MQSNCSRIIVPRILRNLTSLKQPSSRLIPQRTYFGRRSNSLWDIGDTFRQMERQFEQMETELSSLFRNVGLGAKRTLLPSIVSAPMGMYETETDKVYRMNVVIGKNMPPENIKVTMKDRLVNVEVKFEKSYDFEDGKSKISEEIQRSFTLPEGIDVSQIKSTLTPEGILQFEAPLPPKAIEENNKSHEIPIAIKD